MRKQEKACGPKTAYENANIFELLTAITGDVPVSKIDVGVARHVKQTLMKLRRNMSKDKRYAHKPLNDVLALNPTDTLSIDTINKHLSRISGLFAWAERNGHIKQNPFIGLQLKKTKRPYEERQAFDADDLTTLFETVIFHEKQFKHAYYYWLLLLALYTGARY